MRLGIRILIGFLLIFGAAVYYLTHDFLENIRTRYLEGVEEVLVDQAQLLAGFVSADLKGGHDFPKRLREIFDAVHRENFSARIYGLEKTAMDLRVYVTDQQGIVVFDSRDPGLVGADYSAWRDVLLTLRGEYGARTSHEDPLNPHAATLYVAAPVLHQGRVAGVVTVGKPTDNINRFLSMARRQVAGKSIVAVVCVTGLSILFMIVVLRPIRRLTEYAHAVRQGRKVTLPSLGAGEIGDMGRAFEKMRLALEDKAYVERYVQTLTHEIKSPVSAISGAAELLEEEMPPDQRARFLANIRKESERIRKLVERLLALAAIESLPALKANETVALKELIVAAIDQIRPQAANRSIQLLPDLASTGPVAGDPFLLRQAISNLILNAVDFSPEGGRTTVRLMPKDAAAVLIVEDEGPGIPDFASRRVFEKFFSLRRPDTGEKSTGLGLNFVKEIAELHGGSIRLENRRSQGARAVLTLPLLTG